MRGRKAESVTGTRTPFTAQQLAQIALHEELHDRINGRVPWDEEAAQRIGSLVFAYARCQPGEASWQFFLDLTISVANHNKVHDRGRHDPWHVWPFNADDVSHIIRWRAEHPAA